MVRMLHGLFCAIHVFETAELQHMPIFKRGEESLCSISSADADNCMGQFRGEAVIRK